MNTEKIEAAAAQLASKAKEHASLLAEIAQLKRTLSAKESQWKAIQNSLTSDERTLLRAFLSQREEAKC